jgi:hypothetical protein
MSRLGAWAIRHEVDIPATAAESRCEDDAKRHLFGQNNVLLYRTATQTFMLPP